MSFFGLFKNKKDVTQSDLNSQGDGNPSSHWSELLARWEAVVESNPEDIESNLQVLNALMHLGNEDLALKKMVQIEEQFPDERQIKVQIARFQRKHGNIADATERWKTLSAQREMNDVEPDTMLANIYLELDDEQNANRHFDIAREIDENDFRVLLIGSKIEQKKQNWELATEKLLNVIEQKGSHYEAELQLAWCYLKSEDFQKTIEQVDASVQTHPRVVSFLQVKQKALVGLNRIDEAISVGDELLDLEPDNEKYLFDTANLLYQSGKIEEAETICRQALDKYP